MTLPEKLLNLKVKKKKSLFLIRKDIASSSLFCLQLPHRIETARFVKALQSWTMASGACGRRFDFVPQSKVTFCRLDLSICPVI